MKKVIILFCMLTSCVSHATHQKSLSKIRELEFEVETCSSDMHEFETLMMKYRGAVYDKQLCEKRLKSCDQKRLGR